MVQNHDLDWKILIFLSSISRYIYGDIFFQWHQSKKLFMERIDFLNLFHEIYVWKKSEIRKNLPRNKLQNLFFSLVLLNLLASLDVVLLFTFWNWFILRSRTLCTSLKDTAFWGLSQFHVFFHQHKPAKLLKQSFDGIVPLPPL